MKLKFLFYFLLTLLYVSELPSQNYIKTQQLISQHKQSGWEEYILSTDGSVWFFKAHESNINMFYSKKYSYTKKKKKLVYTKRFKQYVVEVDCSTTMFRTLNGTEYVNGEGSPILNYGYNTSTNRFPKDWEIASYGTIYNNYIKKFCSKVVSDTAPTSLSNSDGQYQPNGTGFLICNRFFVTSCHVISDWNKFQLLINGKSYNASLKLSDQSNDLAILEINDTNSLAFENVPYGLQSESKIGESVFVLGFPLSSIMGEEIKITDGIVNSQSGLEGNASQIQVSVPVQPGSSGSPIFNSLGNIVGVITSGLNRAVTENVSYGTKSIYLQVLIDSIDEKIEFKPNGTSRYNDLSVAVSDFKDYVGIVLVK
jgi:S1-C subfamily serine protease